MRRYSSELYGIDVLFAVFVAFEVLMYLVMWRLFLFYLLRQQWEAKALLAIVPPEKIISCPEMRQYIVDNSSASFLTMGSSGFK